jgi:hypothetical protein
MRLASSTARRWARHPQLHGHTCTNAHGRGNLDLSTALACAATRSPGVLQRLQPPARGALEQVRRQYDPDPRAAPGTRAFRKLNALRGSTRRGHCRLAGPGQVVKRPASGTFRCDGPTAVPAPAPPPAAPPQALVRPQPLPHRGRRNGRRRRPARPPAARHAAAAAAAADAAHVGLAPTAAAGGGGAARHGGAGRGHVPQSHPLRWAMACGVHACVRESLHTVRMRNSI